MQKKLVTDHLKAAREMWPVNGIWRNLVGAVWKTEKKKKRDRLIFRYLRFFMNLTLTTFIHRKDLKKSRFEILVLLKRLSAKCYSNCNYQLNSFYMEVAQPQTMEVKEKGKNLPEILTHNLYRVELGHLQTSSSSCIVKDSKILI